MTEFFDFNTLLQFVKNNWAPVVAGAVLLPFALNLSAGVWRRIGNRLRSYPTFAPGAIYVDCVTPSGGYYPRLRCVRNGLLSVTMETPEGAKFIIYNRSLRDEWVLPILYDPMLPDRRDDDPVAWDDPGDWRRRLCDGDELPPSGKNEDVRRQLAERGRSGCD